MMLVGLLKAAACGRVVNYNGLRVGGRQTVSEAMRIEK